MVEPVVIEDRNPHPQRRHETVNARKPVLAFTKVGHHLEPSGRLAQSDDQNVLAVAIDQIEAAAPSGQVAEVGKGRRMDAPGAHGAARRLQQHVERLARTAKVEYVARTQREFLTEGSRQVFVYALEFDAIDHAFVNRQRERGPMPDRTLP